MGNKITITESERNRIKSLYEQPESNSNMSLKVDSTIGFHIRDFVVNVNLEDDSSDDVYVVISVSEDEGLSIKSIDNMGDGELSDEVVRDYVNGLIQNGYFDLRPLYITYDFETEELDADIPRRG